MREVLSEPTARKVVERLLLRAATSQCSSAPSGCLLVKGALACSAASNAVQMELNNRRAAGEAELCRRFKRALREGDLPPEANCADLARYVTTVLYCLTVQAVGGASSKELARMVAVTLENWPTGIGHFINASGSFENEVTQGGVIPSLRGILFRSTILACHKIPRRLGMTPL